MKKINKKGKEKRENLKRNRKNVLISIPQHGN